MRSAAEQQAPTREQQECVDRMEALASEFRLAIKAIAANDVFALEGSVRRQAEEGAQLRAALMACGQAGEMLVASRTGKARVGKVVRNLSRTTAEYAALLDHSGKSMRMLQTLHGQRSAVDAATRMNAGGGYQRWSCEV